VGAGQRDDPVDVVGLAQVDGARLRGRVEAGRQERDDLAGRAAVLDALDRLGLHAVLGAPPAPGAHDRGVRVDEDAVQVGEDRGHAGTVCGSPATV
jgi:hypothetical protein